MATTGFFHHIGTFFLFAATILLLITTISAPVVNDIALLKVTLSNATTSHYSQVSFGTFGYCVLDTANGNHDVCTKHHVGYNAADVLTNIEDTSFSNGTRESVKIMTRVMILHPIATGIAFIAFLLACGAGVFGSLLSAVVSLIAFLTSVVAVIVDFVLFGTLKEHVNSSKHDTSGSHAEFSAAIWTVLVAAVCLLIGAVIVFFTCCSARLHRRRRDPAAKTDYGTPATTRRRRWF